LFEQAAVMEIDKSARAMHMMSLEFKLWSAALRA